MSSYAYLYFKNHNFFQKFYQNLPRSFSWSFDLRSAAIFLFASSFRLNSVSFFWIVSLNFSVSRQSLSSCSELILVNTVPKFELWNFSKDFYSVVINLKGCPSWNYRIPKILTICFRSLSFGFFLNGLSLWYKKW